MADGPWQEREIADFFEGDAGKEFQQRHSALWHRLVVANEVLAIAKALSEFPARTLPLDWPEDRLLDLSLMAFGDSVLSTLVSALSDRKPSVSLLTLKAWMIKNVKEEARKEMCDHLDQVVPSPKDCLAKKAKRLRDKLVDHFDEGPVLNRRQRESIVRVSLADLEALFSKCAEAINQIAIGGGERLMFGVGCDPAAFGESLAGHFAERSGLYWPERSPQEWPRYAEMLTRADRQVFDKWRQELKLDPIDWGQYPELLEGE